MVSKWCEMDFATIHSMALFLREFQEAVGSSSFRGQELQRGARET